jgi:signal transduction histidine kinase
MSRLSLRARLTLVVTAVCALAITVAAVAMHAAMERSLVSAARQEAEHMLSGYLDGLEAGRAVVAQTDPELTPRFVYFNASGAEITEGDYMRTLTDEALSFEARILPPPALVAPLVSVPTMEPTALDVAGNVLAVGVPVAVGDADLTVGVATPLEPISNSLDAVRNALWVVVPALCIGIGLLAWHLTGRALRPVEAITSRVDEIGGTASLDERVPVPAANDEVAHLARTMNDMLGRLQAAADRQRTFVSDASHELRSPIAAATVQLDVALADPDGTDWETTAHVVLAEQRRLAGLVDDLLTLASLDERAQPVLAEEVDLEELALEEAARGRCRAVTVDVALPVRVSGSHALLTRLLANLVDNAARHARSEVRVVVDRAGEEAIVHVDDDGPGVAPADRAVVFDRFTRLDPARQHSTGGAGLGLAIASTIAAQHGGSLHCEDAPSGGARFTLRLPVQAAVRRLDA